MRHFKQKTLVLTLLISLFSSIHALAQETPSLNDAQEVGDFIDQQMTADLATYHLPGAVIAIVKDDQLLYSKGYGMANIENGQPVDAKTSLFRITSTTKLFTWTAVMQLVETGKIDLDEDINTYLTAFQIPATFPEPITMRHLMTHTAGFEEGGVGYQITTDEKKLPVSLKETLKKHQLARIRPVGQLASYSNYGASLAGLIVEEVSGQPYDDYIQEHVFDSLKMTQATVAEPLPDHFLKDRVLGYNFEGDAFVPGTPTYEGGFRPAGSGTISADDMAKFMLAHLNNGSIDGQQLLKSATAKLMHETAFRFDDRLPGSALGFQEGELNGQTLLSHAGADTMFITDLYLIPEQKLGIFLSYSGGDGDGALASMKTAFFDRYFPFPKTEKSSFLPVTTEELSQLTGSYKFSRRNYSDIDKFFSLLTEMTVKEVDGQLAIGQGAEQELFGKIGENLFQQVGGQQTLAFKTDKTGKGTAMLLNIMPDMPLERTHLLDQSRFWLPLLGGSLLIFLGAIGTFLFRIRQLKNRDKRDKQAIWLAFSTSLIAVLTMVLTVTQVLNMDVLERLSSVSLTLNLFLVLPLLIVLLTALLMAKTLMMWRRRQSSLIGRLLFSFIPLAALTLSWFFYHWNLLGWQFG